MSLAPEMQKVQDSVSKVHAQLLSNLMVRRSVREPYRQRAGVFALSFGLEVHFAD